MLGPDAQRLDQRLLQRVLGGVEILAATDESREDLRHEGAEGALVERMGRRHGVSPARAPRT